MEVLLWSFNLRLEFKAAPIVIEYCGDSSVARLLSFMFTAERGGDITFNCVMRRVHARLMTVDLSFDLEDCNKE